MSSPHCSTRPGDERPTLASAQEASSLSVEYGFPFWIAAAEVMQGWALCAQGSSADGIERIRRGLAAYQSVGAEASRPQFLAALADAHGRMGQAEEGLVVLQEALVTASRTGELHYEAELYRSRGGLRLMLGAEQDAEEDFQKALAISRRQGAKMLELRAATSLGRLWQERREEAEAGRLLKEILDRFTEGLETRDLTEARGLLSNDTG
jgi:predicted ATPase